MLVKRVKVYVAEADGILGTGDAAASALAVGGIKVAFDNVCAFTGFERGVCDVFPDYDCEVAKIAVFGIISLCIADIISAAVSALIKTVTDKRGKRRIIDYANIASE